MCQAFEIRALSFLSFMLLICPCAGSDSLVNRVSDIRQPAALSPYNRHKKDEDPCIIRTQGGQYFLSWVSKRNDGDHIFIQYSNDSIGWSEPIQVTFGNSGDYYPTIYQDDERRFHLVWFRKNRNPPFHSSILYNQSPDGVNWNPRAERSITQGVADDWVPVILKDRSGRLLVYFTAKRRGDKCRHIYLSQSLDYGNTWGNPEQPVGLAAGNLTDDFPYIVQNNDGQFLITWTRYKKSLGSLFNKTMDIYLSSSYDGVHWQQPVNVTNSGEVTDVFSFFYRNPDGNWFLGWVTTQFDPQGSTVGIPLAQINENPKALTLLNAQGYSPRIVATQTPGQYLMVWVGKDAGGLRIFHKLFSN